MAMTAEDFGAVLERLHEAATGTPAPGTPSGDTCWARLLDHLDRTGDGEPFVAPVTEPDGRVVFALPELTSWELSIAAERLGDVDPRLDALKPDKRVKRGGRWVEFEHDAGPTLATEYARRLAGRARWRASVSLRSGSPNLADAFDRARLAGPWHPAKIWFGVAGTPAAGAVLVDLYYEETRLVMAPDGATLAAALAVASPAPPPAPAPPARSVTLPDGTAVGLDLLDEDDEEPTDPGELAALETRGLAVAAALTPAGLHALLRAAAAEVSAAAWPDEPHQAQEAALTEELALTRLAVWADGALLTCAAPAALAGHDLTVQLDADGAIEEVVVVP